MFDNRGMGNSTGPVKGLNVRLMADDAAGTDDVIVPPSNAQILLSRIPRATALRVRDAGHAFLFQDPTTTARAFSVFLKGG